MKKREKLFSDSAIVAQLSQSLNRSLDMLAHNTSDPSVELLINAQRDSFTKKFLPADYDTDGMDRAAYDLFRSCNMAMMSVNHLPYPSHRGSHLSRLHRVLLRARNVISSLLGDFCEEEWFLHCKHSSGSSIGVTFSDTSIEAKSKELTYSGKVKGWFSYYLSYDPQLRRALESFGSVYREVSGSRATTVPKDKNKVRMICVEPTLNMFFQQGLMQCLTTRLERAGLSFESQQDVNRFYAWYSSLTGKYATIDWTSASDSVSYSLAAFLIPRDWFLALDMCTSRFMEIEGSVEKLHMFSTMGNACTFPLETLVFWSLAVALQSLDDRSTSNLLEAKPYKDVQVFGDDCILLTSHADEYIRILRSLGFTPNEKKTFLTGSFRESCGGDFVAGKDVRPYSLTGPSGSSRAHLQAWLNIITNRTLNRAIRLCGTLSYIYYFQPVFEELFKIYRDHGLDLLIVPTHYPDDSGVKIGVDFCRFLRHFSIRKMLGEVTIDRHSTRRFRYLSATYPKRKAVDLDLRYWLAIKGLVTQTPSYHLVRRRITYVVQKGSSHWFTIDR